MAEEADSRRRGKEAAAAAQARQQQNVQLQSRELWELIDTAVKEFVSVARQRHLKPDGRSMFKRWWNIPLATYSSYFDEVRDDGTSFTIYDTGKWSVGYYDADASSTNKGHTYASSDRPGVADRVIHPDRVRQVLVDRLSSLS